MKNLRIIFFFLVLFSFFISANAQTAVGGATISGQVLDNATGEQIIGASIAVVNENTGTASGIDGNFIVRTKSLPVKLAVSYLGYKTVEINVRETSKPVVVKLQEDRNLLSEVVVVGYGTQKRKELTGSVASLSKNALEQSAISIDGLLGGAISGVNVTQISGQPGSGSEIRIRGGNSIYASNEPLYVIDGFIYFSEKGATQAGIGGIESSLNPLASINPSDIESIEILKDVSAKAIYGSRGANGVILVTTKKGKRGGNSVHYQYTIGVDKSAKKLDLLNAEQWTDIHQRYTSYFYNPVWDNKTVTTDWQDAVLQTGSTETHELSISGGDETTRFLFSGNYTDQKGIVINSGFERYSGRINIDKQLYHNLIVGITASADRSTQNALTTLNANDYKGTSSPFKSGITNSLVYALFMPPVIPIYTTTGDYNYINPFEISELNYYGKSTNPVSDLRNSIGQTISTSLLGNFYAKYNLPSVEGLAVKFSAGTNISYITQNFFAPPTSGLGHNADIQGKGSIGNRKTDINQTEYLLTYTKQLAPAHFIDLLAGYTHQVTNTYITRGGADHLDEFEDLEGAVGTISVFNKPDHATLNSILTRANYTLLEKYNLTATWRADKSTRFAKGHRWGHFPSIGFSWNVSDEDFFENVKLAVSTLKFRATYGKAGQQEIGFSEALVDLDASGRYNGQSAYIWKNLGNTKLKWETTTEYNVGIDAELIDGKLALVVDAYFKKTDDLLVKVEPKLGSPTDELQTINFGNVTNQGFEGALNAKLIERKQFTWSAAANFARNINTITKVKESMQEGEHQEKTYRIGESVGSFYGFIYDGVDPVTGNAILRDLNHDTKIDAINDRTVVGSIQPDFTYGFSSNLAYRNWDLFLSLQGSQGNEVYNKLRRHLSEGNRTYNLSTDLLNAWTSSVPKVDFIQDTNNNVTSTTLYSRYVEDASFLKVRNITLGYNLPVKISGTSVKFRVFVSAQNLYTFTKYTGYDPEVAGGIDTGAYPASRAFLLGAGITF